MREARAGRWSPAPDDPAPGSGVLVEPWDDKAQKGAGTQVEPVFFSKRIFSQIVPPNST